jgi:NAD(P)-dependent dehydrogenase (short-subunit alcohol dehydrogenase family)
MEQHKTALITGASHGLGQALAGFLAAQGWDLLVNARTQSDLERAADDLVEKGANVTAVAGDVSDPDVRREMAGAASRAGRLELLVNNASELGPSPLKTLDQLSSGELRRILEVNLLAPLELTKSLLPVLEDARGLVVNISSDAAAGGYEGWGGYGASKAALDLASLTLANELRGRHVYVVAVDPGDMRTRMHQDAFPGEDISDRPSPEVTLPFWAWLLGQDPAAISGRRFRAQAESWVLAA